MPSASQWGRRFKSLEPKRTYTSGESTERSAISIRDKDAANSILTRPEPAGKRFSVAVEVSAILVEPDAVWLALDHFGEDISTAPGGLAVWNRRTRAIQRSPLEFNISSMTRTGGALRLTTNGGYALFEYGGQVRRFMWKAE